MLVFLMTIDDEKQSSKIEAIYMNYSQEMYNVAYSILKKKEDADDAVQMAFIRIFENLDKLSDPDSNRVKYYVLKVAKSVALDIYREKKRRWSREILVDETYVFDIETKEKAIGENELVYRILNLEQRDSDILMLKYVHGFKYSEIGKMLGISEETAKKAGNRARKKLEKKINMEESKNDG